MKNLIFFLAIAFLGSCGSKKQKTANLPSSGEVHYVIDLDLIPSAQQMKETFGDAATIKFNERYVRLQKETSTPAEEFYITDNVVNEKLAYVEFLDNKFAIIEDPSLLPAPGSFTLHEEYLDIAGFKCQKATAPLGDKMMTVYFTKLIGTSYAPYGDLDGFALQYELEFPYGTVTYTADKVMLKEMNPLFVNPPSGFKKITMREFQMQMKELASPIPEGVMATNFVKKDYKGNEVELKSLIGKVVVVNFWFTNCQPCIAEMPSLNELKSDYADKDVEFLAVTFEDQKAISGFLQNHKFEFDIIPESRDVITEYEVIVYPTTVVINKFGHVVNTKMGGGSNIKSELAGYIDAALN